MSEGISKGERDELRRIVRGDFKALGMELHAREAEILADIEQRVAQRFQPDETALADAEAKMGEIVGRANREMAAVVDDLRQHVDGYDITVDRMYIPLIAATPSKRHEMRRALIAELTAEVVKAKTVMARQENDLLRKLSADALTSSGAHEFLASIPTVAALVPMARMAELEAQFSDEAPDA